MLSDTLGDMDASIEDIMDGMDEREQRAFIAGMAVGAGLANEVHRGD